MKKMFVLVIALVCCCIVPNAFALNKFSGGFYYPLENFTYSTSGTWLGPGLGHAGPHGHIGVDMLVPEGTNVYAVANGIVLQVSVHGWGNNDNNVAVLVKHSIFANGEEKDFIVLYGHLTATSALKKNAKVYAGKTIIGKIGPYSTEPHLHLGVVPPNNVLDYGPTYGYATSSDHNGFVDPIKFLQNHAPYIDLSDDSQPVEISVRQIANIAWYPPTKTCINAEKWFKVQDGKAVQEFQNNGICWSIDPIAYGVWYNVVFGENDLPEACIQQ